MFVSSQRLLDFGTKALLRLECSSKFQALFETNYEVYSVFILYIYL